MTTMQKSNDMTYSRLIALALMVCCCLPSLAQMRIEDMDEDDWMARRDTMSMTRRNLAEKSETTNAMAYILDDDYVPEHESFDRHWYDHVYFGMTGGMEKVLREKYVPELSLLPQMGIFVGKQFTPKHSARLTLGGAVGYQKADNARYYRGSMKADYLFSLSTHFAGYNPMRRLDVSLLGGVGGNVSKTGSMKAKVSGEVHAGLQFKVYTGPYASLALEPYVGLATDALDLSGRKNWRGYDIVFGLNAAYIFYTDDNLSKESRRRELEARLEGDRLIDRFSLSSWRTPWFLETSTGLVGGIRRTGSEASGIGNGIQLGVGRWMSPVIGLRGMVGSKMTENDRITVPVNGGTAEKSFFSRYTYGRIDALFNPLGFSRSFSWDAPCGAYLLAGMEVGKAERHDAEGSSFPVAAAYSAGVHLWYRLSKDLQVFVEPTYNYMVHNSKATAGSTLRSHDHTYNINLGLSMLIRSARYREPDEFDRVQNFNYRHVRGFAVGVAGGMPILQRKGTAMRAQGGFNYDAMAFLEYRVNHLHGLRLAADFLNLKGSTLNDRMLQDANSRLLITSLNYQLNLTNLFSGRFHRRLFQLEMFAGAAIGTVVGGARAQKNTFPGLDLGLKLSMPVWKGLSVIAQPTVYVLKDAQLPGINTVGMGGNTHMFETFNIGVQCDLSIFKRNMQKVRARKVKADMTWAEKQQRAIRKLEAERQAKRDKRKQKYNGR